MVTVLIPSVCGRPRENFPGTIGMCFQWLNYILLKYFCGKKDCIDHIAYNPGKVGEGED